MYQNIPQPNENARGKFLAVCLVLGVIYIVFSFAFRAYADPPTSPFIPGETLNPNCSPTSTNCTVQPPLFSTTTLPVGGVLFVNDASGTITANTSSIFWNASTSQLQVGSVPTQGATDTVLSLGNDPLQGGNVSGTYLGINTTSTFNGDFLNFEDNSSTKFKVASSGMVTANSFQDNNDFNLGTTTNPAADLFYAATAKPIFFMNTNGSVNAGGTFNASGTITQNGVAVLTTSTITTSSAITLNALPLWTAAAQLGNSLITQNTSSIQILQGPQNSTSVPLFALGLQFQSGNVSGTLLGGNVSSSFNGDFLNFEKNSSTVFDVASSGALTVGTSTFLNSSFFSIASTSNIFTVLANGNVGIGTSSPSQALSVVGNISNLTGNNQYVNQVATTTVGGNPNSIYVSGRYAYMTNLASANISVVDILNPLKPVLIATTTVGGNPYAIAISGRYAYVANNGSNTISVVDISNPAKPIQVATTSVGGGPQNIAISGRYAYVGNEGSSTMSVVDISNPALPLQIATTSVNGPESISILGKYVYVGTNGSNIYVFDVSNPLKPLQVGTTVVGSLSQGIALSGRYAYTANYNSSTISVVDISNPTAPIQVATTSVGGNPWSIYVSGRYAYTANTGSSTISVVDISNPSAPIQVATTSVGIDPEGIFVSGRYAYVPNENNNIFSVVDIGGLETTSLLAGSEDVGQLQVRNDLNVQGQLQVYGGENVGQGGIYSSGAVSSGSTSTPSMFMGGIAVGTSSLFGATTTLTVCARSNCTIPTTASGTNSVAFFASTGGNTTDISIVARGVITGGLTDVGEFIPVVGSDTDYTAGDVVSMANTSTLSFEKSSGSYDPTVAGVVSVTAGLVAGGGEAHGTTIIALAGRVPVTVTTASGPIKVGDELTASDISGVAMRATQPGRVIGLALAEDDGDPNNPNATSQVMMFVNPHWSLGNLTNPADIASSSWALVGTTASSSPLDQFTAYVQAALAKLGLVIQDGVATLQGIVVDSVTMNQLCVQGVCASADQLSAIMQRVGATASSSSP